jgi:hypothetical protein
LPLGLDKTWYDAAVEATADGEWAEANLVWVMNPADTTYTAQNEIDKVPQAQSMLYEVPEPGALALLATGVSSVLATAWIRRRRARI